MTKPGRHVVSFTFPFGSQPIPLLNLVLKLSRAAPDVAFSFFNTAASNGHLNLSSHRLPDNVKTYTVEDGLSQEVQPSERLSGVSEVDAYLKVAPDNFRSAVEAATAERGVRVTCLLVDAVVSSCVHDLARQLHVPWIPVWFPLPAALLSHVYTDLIRDEFCASDERDLAMTIPSMSVFRVKDLPEVVLVERDSLFSRSVNQLGRVLPQAKALVVCFFKELNQPSLNIDLESKFPNVLHVGNIQKPLTRDDSDTTGCLSWLDGREAKSVVYISFGTAVTLPPEEMGELAEALEASHVSFLWSLRDNLHKFLPSGFQERTRMVGKIVSWAPQVRVLGHGSVGVFVTQGGCNSLIESIAASVPIICRPIFADQMMVARMVEEYWGIGRRTEGGVVTKIGFVKSLESVLGDEKVREKVEATKELVLKACEAHGSATQDTKTLVEMIYD